MNPANPLSKADRTLALAGTLALVAYILVGAARDRLDEAREQMHTRDRMLRAAHVAEVDRLEAELQRANSRRFRATSDGEVTIEPQHGDVDDHVGMGQ